jgi:hypothetical protein
VPRHNGQSAALTEPPKGNARSAARATARPGMESRRRGRVKVGALEYAFTRTNLASHS